MLVQEDKAPAHASKYQDEIFRLYDIMRLLWPGNSLDMNMIKSCWPSMKRTTIKKGAPQTRKDIEERWKKTWKELPQEKIQGWIERIPQHLRIIRFLKGDNKYKEGRVDGRTDTKEGKKHLAELIAETEKAEAFEINSELRRMSDSSIRSTIVVDYHSSSDDSNIPGPSIRIPQPIHYS